MTDSSKPTLLVVDGHSLAFRAFYALPVDNFSTKDGQHTNGVYGFLSMFVNLLKAEKPSHVAVAFDTSRQSFRTREYAEYKANRSESPPEFSGQIPLLQECLQAMNVPVLMQPDIEADDMDRVWWALATRFDPKRSAQIIDRGRSTPLDPGLPIEARDITSRIILDACTPYEWKNKPNEIFMDRAMLQKVSSRWNEYGFAGTSPVAEMINRLTRPEAPAKKAKTHEM